MSASVFAALAEKPKHGLLALCLAQLMLWTLAPALSHTTPPLDVVEMYAWGREGVVATFKHPNLPGLILEGVRQLTGQAGWPAYLISQILIVITFLAVFLLGRDLMGAPRALAGTALLTGVYFFSWVTPELNHNVMQMPLWALIALCLWRAGEQRGLIWWLLLGLFGGLSLWAKYSSAMILAPAALWLAWDAKARRAFLSPGPYLALIVFALAAAPQALWLIAHDFQPFAYAARRAAGTGDPGGLFAALEFLLSQAVYHLPLAVIAWSAGLFGKPAAEAPPAPDRRALHFLLWIGLGPTLLTVLAALLAGMGLKTAWGAAMYNLSGLLVVALLSSRCSGERLKRVAVGACVLLVLAPALYFTQTRFGAALTGKVVRGNWPQSQISETLTEVHQRETGAPPRIVAGDIFTAGLINMDARRPPSVLINGDLSISPWVSARRLDAEGALLVWRADGAPSPEVQALSQGLEVRKARFTYPNAPAADPLVLKYAILPPRAKTP